ncbi:MAG: DUF4147 domain-containing protein [Promethearchaeota archaeon]|nr:MAG: DUF4147 domain-containing protein [Candidatus Lokiarchaeota archaeon]
MSPSIIKNYSQLLPSHLSKPQLLLRKTILHSLELAITSVMPNNLMEKSLKIENEKLIVQKDEYNLKNFEEIYIIGGGKATAHMAAFLGKLLSKIPNIMYKGIINIPDGLEIDHLDLDDYIQINYASHPIPNKTGMYGVQKMLELIKASSKNSLIIFLVSGGGSALLPLPRDSIQLEDLQVINNLLLESGASIHEINIIRKHLSGIKGGNLARLLFNTSQGTLVALIISDVVGNDLDSIASGPSVPDPSTFNDVRNILKKYDLLEKIPSSISSLIEEAKINHSLETPKPGDKCFANVHNYLIGSVESAVNTIEDYIKSEGFTLKTIPNIMIGEARTFGKKIFEEFFTESNESYKRYTQFALLGTGELTVTLRENGIGGRNQEMLLSFLNQAKKEKIHYDFCLIAANLDGIEGNSKAMGALVDNEVCNQVLKLNLDIPKYLDHNDSNSMFKTLGTELITGPTGCNVNDIMILLKSRHSML